MITKNENGSILVVEDEPLIRMSLTDHLESSGFAVHETGSADRAIDLLKEGKVVDLIITDVRLPGRNDGISLALWVREYHPHIKLIIVSGATEDSPDLEKLGSEGIIIQKPYLVDDIASRAHSLLSG
jgi:CheY-like chemotaxis protein